MSTMLQNLLFGRPAEQKKADPPKPKERRKKKKKKSRKPREETKAPEPHVRVDVVGAVDELVVDARPAVGCALQPWAVAHAARHN